MAIATVPMKRKKQKTKKQQPVGQVLKRGLTETVAVEDLKVILPLFLLL